MFSVLAAGTGHAQPALGEAATLPSEQAYSELPLGSPDTRRGGVFLSDPLCSRTPWPGGISDPRSSGWGCSTAHSSCPHWRAGVGCSGLRRVGRGQ